MFYLLITPLVWLFALFVFFLAYITVIRTEESGVLREASLVFRLGCWCVKVLGGIIDITFNLVVGTLLFLEWPELRNITFTHRCAKWMFDEGLRGKIARFFCTNLSVFDRGHCKPRH